jgi:hypothetical protein
MLDPNTGCEVGMVPPTIPGVPGNESTTVSLPRKAKWQSNSVRRAFEILELLGRSPQGWNISELSRKLSMPKSTTFVLLSTLENLGYVSRSSRNYTLGLKTYSLGSGLIDDLDRAKRAVSVLRPWRRALV